jgi:hypothetical protein
MPTPRITSIADAALARIAAITTGGGYNYTTGVTKRYLQPADETTKFPAAFLHHSYFEERKIVLATDGPNARESVAVLKIRIFVQDNDSPWSALEAWAYDVNASIEAAPIGLGLPYVIHVVTSGLEVGPGDLEMQKPFAAGTLTVGVIYRMARGVI